MAGLTESIMTGIIASVVAVAMIEVIRKTREFVFYRRIVGRYSVYLIGGEKVEGEVVELVYRGGRLIKAKSELNGSPCWNSSIVMNSSNPFHGEGVYNYLEKDDFGLHSILISLDQNQISVHFRNLSHRDGRYGGVLWRKEGLN